MKRTNQKLTKKPSKKNLIPRPKTAKAMLLLLREFLSNEYINPDNRRALWDILTALRGPDNGHDYTKRSTTCVVRRALMGKKRYLVFALTGEDDKNCRDFRLSESVSSSAHFASHATRAFFKLGLTWNKPNSPKIDYVKKMKL